MNESPHFTQASADAYFERNQSQLDHLLSGQRADPVCASLEALELVPERVLEIGAANGWRLERLRQSWPESQFFGLEPSQRAVADGQGRFPDIELQCGSAEDLPYKDGYFDLVIFGFCLYLCPRTALFAIAAAADRVLATEGTLLIHDFLPDAPCRNPYAHEPGLFSYKMDYSKMFSWNPQYQPLQQHLDDQSHDGATPGDRRVAVSLLRKTSINQAYPGVAED